jgi:hypothetical protein
MAGRWAFAAVLVSFGAPASDRAWAEAASAEPRDSREPPGVEADPPLDVVRLRLLRNETRRWQLLATVPADDSFDDWAFGGVQGETRFRDQLDKLLQRRIREVEQIFQLTDAQRRKLLLAGRGDIKRLLEVIDDARSEFQLARSDLHRLTELRSDLRLVELRIIEGPFGLGSLFDKTLRKMIDEKLLRRRRAAGGR